MTKMILDGEEVKVDGIHTRELMSHKAGEQFVYDGRLFTRLHFPGSLLLWLTHYDEDGHKPMKDCNLLAAGSVPNSKFFFAADQFGVISVFSRNEDVVTIFSRRDA